MKLIKHHENNTDLKWCFRTMVDLILIMSFLAKNLLHNILLSMAMTKHAHIPMPSSALMKEKS